MFLKTESKNNCLIKNKNISKVFVFKTNLIKISFIFVKIYIDLFIPGRLLVVYFELSLKNFTSPISPTSMLHLRENFTSKNITEKRNESEKKKDTLLLET